MTPTMVMSKPLNSALLAGLCWALLLHSSAALAARASAPSDKKNDYEEPVEWIEQELPAPLPFDAKRALPFAVEGPSEMRFTLDPQTLQIGTDGVVRYVVLATSPSGSQNVFYEGVRCSVAQYRQYALWQNPTENRPEGRWSFQKDSPWRDITRSASRLHVVSLRGVICDNAQVPPYKLDEVLERLKQAKPLR